MGNFMPNQICMSVASRREPVIVLFTVIYRCKPGVLGPHLRGMLKNSNASLSMFPASSEFSIFTRLSAAGHSHCSTRPSAVACRLSSIVHSLTTSSSSIQTPIPTEKNRLKETYMSPVSALNGKTKSSIIEAE